MKHAVSKITFPIFTFTTIDLFASGKMDSKLIPWNDYLQIIGLSISNDWEGSDVLADMNIKVRIAKCAYDQNEKSYLNADGQELSPKQLRQPARKQF